MIPTYVTAVPNGTEKVSSWPHILRNNISSTNSGISYRVSFSLST
jgi:hypothetical protein